MAIRRWMFFHPNDGTRPYPDMNPETNQPLWERILDQDDLIERQGAHINDLAERLRRYEGMVAPGEVVQGIAIFNRREYFDDLSPNYEERLRERLINQQLDNLITELRNRNLIEIDFSMSDTDPDEIRLRTRLRVIPPNN